MSQYNRYGRPINEPPVANYSSYLARADFKALCSKENSQLVVEAADRGLDITLDATSTALALGLSAAVIQPTKEIHSSDPKPWFEK